MNNTRIREALASYYAEKKLLAAEGYSRPAAGPRYVKDFPSGVIGRYITVAGAHTDITYRPWEPLLITCSGCQWRDHSWNRLEVSMDDTPEEESDKVAEWIPHAREAAQAHAERCRAVAAE